MKTISCVVVMCVALAYGQSAHAHAFLDHARPAVGSTVHGSPGEVRLWFTAPLEAAFSTVKIMDNTGKQVDKQDKHLDRRDPALLEVSLPPLPPGTYRVLWRVLSVDSHVTNGDFTFEIAP